MRKTKKYYREQLTKSIASGAAVIEEVLDKYFSTVHYYTDAKGNRHRYKNVKALAKSDNEFWNCGIISLSKSINPKDYPGVFVGIYWQGDSTDGTDFVTLNTLLNNSEYTISSNEQHSALKVKREWLKSTFEDVAKQL